MNKGNWGKIRAFFDLQTEEGFTIKGKTTYAMEGSIFIAGAGVQWLRDRMNFFKKASETEKIVKLLKDNNNVYLVPAFTGLGAPYWNENARGVLSGLTRDTGPKQIVRADIDYAEAEALTTYGIIGIKVWIYKGEIFTKEFSQETNKK